jgi:hypothetical protein
MHSKYVASAHVLFVLATGLSLSDGGSDVDCINQPADRNCASFQLNASQCIAGIKLNCDGDLMGYRMSSCSVWALCQTADYATKPYCRPFSVLKDTCTDMDMGGCGDYTHMCKAGSAVLQCNSTSLAEVLPNSVDTQKQLLSICSEMAMDGCEVCKGDSCTGDILTAYSKLCYAMPTMAQCSQWHELCVVIPTWPYCFGERAPSDSVIMKMYFHTGISEYILFNVRVVPRLGCGARLVLQSLPRAECGAEQRSVHVVLLTRTVCASGRAFRAAAAELGPHI